MQEDALEGGDGLGGEVVVEGETSLGRRAEQETSEQDERKRSHLQTTV